MNEDIRFIRREMQQIRSQLANVESRARQSWSSVPANTQITPTYFLFCRSGNALATVGSITYYGLKQPATDILTVPTVVPSTTNGACPDGLTWATLISDSGALSQVWAGVRLKPGSDAAITDYGGVLAYVTPFISRRIVMMPLVSDAAVLVPVYLPWRV